MSNSKHWMRGALATAAGAAIAIGLLTAAPAQARSDHDWDGGVTYVDWQYDHGSWRYYPPRGYYSYYPPRYYYQSPPAYYYAPPPTYYYPPPSVYVPLPGLNFQFSF